MQVVQATISVAAAELAVKVNALEKKIIQAIAISADDLTTWSPHNWTCVPWMQVILDKDRPICLAATI